jgi:hypothetical protein
MLEQNDSNSCRFRIVSALSAAAMRRLTSSRSMIERDAPVSGINRGESSAKSGV